MNAKIEGMFSIFQKKTYLIDLFQNFTDFHNHILPGIDDGAQTISDSLGIINEFHQIGINDFVCTPHVMGDYYPNTPQTILEALEKVNNSSDFNLRASAEYMLDQNFIDILNEKKILNEAMARINVNVKKTNNFSSCTVLKSPACCSSVFFTEKPSPKCSFNRS